ncbi:MAG: TolC family protein [Deltaproteobacteria bacterium]|nr:TolC family protein [Deltaproteobacteria bacterium]
MQRPALIVGLLLALLLRSEAHGTQAQDTTLTLQEAIDTALAQHPTLRIGQATVEAAQQRVHQQVAGYLPSGGYLYNYTRKEQAVTAAVGGVQAGQQARATSQLFNFNSTNFSMSQLLFDFGRTLDSIRAAIADVEASNADLDTTRQTVILNTKQAYYSVLANQRLLQVADETVRQNQKHLEEAQARYQVGLAPRFDVTQAQVQLSTAQLNQVIARNNVALARETLRTAMGVIGPFPVVLVDTLQRGTLTLNDEALLTQAYTHRPELRSIQAQQRAAADQVSALQKQYLPSVSGNAQYNWSGREYPLQQGWLWGVTLTFPLFNDFLTVGQVGEAKANLRGLQAQEDNLRQQIALEVRQSFLTVRQAEESIGVSEQTVGQAQENLAIAEGRYAAGVGNIIELTDAQVSLTSAEANNIQALSTYKTAVAQLEKAINQSVE